ncbi:hypothetical protein BASA83_011104 [Batrachochytrium salamandrivorans]|nr:hypothetical protein BASA83_011104 [Batrachochytrium salamandrivorans]
MDPKRSLKRACRCCQAGSSGLQPDRANREQCMAKVESDLAQCLSGKPQPPPTPDQDHLRDHVAQLSIFYQIQTTHHCQNPGTVTFTGSEALHSL